MKNHSDELIFHSQGLRRSVANLGSHRRLRNLKVHRRKTFKCEILLARLRAKRFGMMEKVFPEAGRIACEKEGDAFRELTRGVAARSASLEFTYWIIRALTSSPASMQICIWEQIILN